MFFWKGEGALSETCVEAIVKDEFVSQLASETRVVKLFMDVYCGVVCSPPKCFDRILLKIKM